MKFQLVVLMLAAIIGIAMAAAKPKPQGQGGVKGSENGNTACTAYYRDIGKCYVCCKDLNLVIDTDSANNCRCKKTNNPHFDYKALDSLSEYQLIVALGEMEDN